HHHQRNRAHAVDVDRRRQHQPLLARQAHQRQHRAEQHAADGGDQRQHQAEIQPLEHEVAQQVPVVETKVDLQVHAQCPPAFEAEIMPGTWARFSIQAMSRLIANAEITYRPVTARYTSMPRPVSSWACIANMVNSVTETAKATDEFLKMFIVSLVSGGMMMRSPMGSST